jgi:hypothetical protein
LAGPLETLRFCGYFRQRNLGGCKTTSLSGCGSRFFIGIAGSLLVSVSRLLILICFFRLTFRTIVLLDLAETFALRKVVDQFGSTNKA